MVIMSLFTHTEVAQFQFPNGPEMFMIIIRTAIATGLHSQVFPLIKKLKSNGIKLR